MQSLKIRISIREEVLKMKTEDLLLTLEVCRKYLPSDTHPVHYDRIRMIESILKGIANLDKIRQV